MPSVDGPNQPCVSPLTFNVATRTTASTSSPYEHRRGRERVRVGLVPVEVDKGSGQDYTISGNLSSLLYPGITAQPINVAFSSPNAGTGIDGTRVSNLTVAITSITGPNITALTAL